MFITSTSQVKLLIIMVLPHLVNGYMFDIEGKRNFNSRQYQIYVLLDKNTKNVYKAQ